ncbi:PAS domain S-box protein [Pseudomonadota bacterium]
MTNEHLPVQALRAPYSVHFGRVRFAHMYSVLTFFVLTWNAASAWALHPEQAPNADDSALTILSVGLVIAVTFLITILWRLRESTRKREQAERQLSTALDCISDGFAIFDADDRLIVCNQQLRDMDPAIAERLHPGAKGDDGQPVEQSGCHTQETEAQLSDGRWVLHRDRVLPDGGKVGVRTDITAQKTRERILHESAARYRDLVERSPAPIYVHRDQMVIYANPATAKLLGYEASDALIGKNIFELIHPDHHKLGQLRLKNANAASTSLPQVDMKFVRADGTTIHTEAQVNAITFDGEPALESILHDISARRRMERALMESEQRYRTLFELAPDAMLVHDGSQILFANKATAAILGAARETDLCGLCVRDLTVGDTDHRTLRETAHDSANPMHACRLKRLDGEVFDAEVMAAPVNHHDQKAYHAVIRDVTERTRMDATESPQRRAPTDRDASHGTAGHILVVEDEVEAAQAMRDFLQEEGFKVSLAYNGRTGLDTYRDLHPDVVITDIRMPGMDGTDLIQALRIERADLPIIAVAGHMGETKTIDAGAGSKPVDVLTKPISLMALSRKIGQICAA